LYWAAEGYQKPVFTSSTSRQRKGSRNRLHRKQENNYQEKLLPLGEWLVNFNRVDNSTILGYLLTGVK